MEGLTKDVIFFLSLFDFIVIMQMEGLIGVGFDFLSLLCLPDCLFPPGKKVPVMRIVSVLSLQCGISLAASKMKHKRYQEE